jgi:hypothetical protein
MLAIRAAPEATLLEAGVGSSPWLHRTKKILEVITAAWMVEAMMFMAEFRIDLHNDVNYAVKYNRDEFPNARFVCEGASDQELTLLNQCYILMQVFILADVSTGDGTELMRNMFKGEASMNQYTYRWPIQPHPGNVAWKVWQWYLRFMVTSEATLELKQPLREWTVSIGPVTCQYSQAVTVFLNTHSQVQN